MQHLEPSLREESFPGDGPYLCLDAQGVKAAAEYLGCSPTGAMVACLEKNIWPLRFCRNRGLFSAAEQARLLTSHAAQIGCGGLGGSTATLLVRLGLGGLTLCDPDSFSESNLNRQSLCREDSLGINKAIAARTEVGRIASHVTVRVFPVAAMQENIGSILSGADVVLDGLDNLESRGIVLRAARKAGIPYVYGAIAGQEGFACLEDASSGPVLDAVLDVPPDHSPLAEQFLGVPTLTPMATAVIQCLLAVKCLLGKPSDARLWHMDLATPEIEGLQWF
ncbi:ThiF family adenylyltransferase [Desulfovibrio sp. OttesenSCG-928-M16]|nr:ThiF family adenylyltransferase [Desulfovibrio sp. OttesenSCG-928-M16]